MDIGVSFIFEGDTVFTNYEMAQVLDNVRTAIRAEIESGNGIAPDEMITLTFEAAAMGWEEEDNNHE
jgi:hypothetical protein